MSYTYTLKGREQLVKFRAHAGRDGTLVEGWKHFPQSLQQALSQGIVETSTAVREVVRYECGEDPERVKLTEPAASEVLANLKRVLGQLIIGIREAKEIAARTRPGGQVLTQRVQSVLATTSARSIGVDDLRLQLDLLAAVINSLQRQEAQGGPPIEVALGPNPRVIVWGIDGRRQQLWGQREVVRRPEGPLLSPQAEIPSAPPPEPQPTVEEPTVQETPDAAPATDPSPHPPEVRVVEHIIEVVDEPIEEEYIEFAEDVVHSDATIQSKRNWWSEWWNGCIGCLGALILLALLAWLLWALTSCAGCWVPVVVGDRDRRVVVPHGTPPLQPSAVAGPVVIAPGDASTRTGVGPTAPPQTDDPLSPADCDEKTQMATVLILIPTGPNSAKSGSGFFATPDGLILTNRHVAEDAIEVGVRLHGETEFREAEVVELHPQHDLAILRMKSAFQPAAWLPISRPAIGMPVHAAGYPPGPTDVPVYTYTAGSIATDTDPQTGYLQIDIEIRQGNSGGPLVGPDCSVVGINTAGKIAQEHVIELAIDATIAEQFLNDVRSRHRP